MNALAFLNFGGQELVLVLAIFVMLFGIDKAPALARQLGRVQARVAGVRKEIQREMRTAEERALDDLRAFEKQREAQVRSTTPEFLAEQGVRDAARALGIADADTAPLADLKRAVRDRVADRP